MKTTCMQLYWTITKTKKSEEYFCCRLLAVTLDRAANLIAVINSGAAVIIT